MIADIGGTNARFALLDGVDRRDEIVLACADYPDLVSATEEYLQRVGAKGQRPSARSSHCDCWPGDRRHHSHDQSCVAVLRRAHADSNCNCVV